MPIVTIKGLMEAGVHYGTKSSLWHPGMRPYIFAKRNGVHIIDLKATAKALIQAHYFFKKLAKANKSVLFVGTKRQSKDVTRESARSVGMPYVVERWLGGTMTNLETIRSSIRRLEEIEKEMAEPDYFRRPKKVQARHGRQRRRIVRNLEGVRNMTKLPDALFVIDARKEMTAIREARRLDIPVVALLDTDCDPGQVNLPIPGNDDGIRSIQLVMGVILDALRQGRQAQIQRKEEEKVTEHPTEEQAAAEAEAKAEAGVGGEAKVDPGSSGDAKADADSGAQAEGAGEAPSPTDPSGEENQPATNTNAAN